MANNHEINANKFQEFQVLLSIDRNVTSVNNYS